MIVGNHLTLKKKEKSYQSVQWSSVVDYKDNNDITVLDLVMLSFINSIIF